MLAFERCGDVRQPAVVLLHGFMGSCADWDTVADGLLDRFQCIQIDLPGHGQSKITPGTLAPDMAETAAQVLNVLDLLGLERCAVVGYSLGGRLALYMALEHPDRVMRAVIESASPGLPTEDERTARRKRDEAMAAALEDSPIEAFVRWWYEQPLFETIHSDPVRFKRLMRARLQNDPRGLAASLRAIGAGAQPSLWERLGENRVPLLFVAGELDEKYREMARRMAQQIPLSTAQTVPGCGHNVHFENPAEYTRRLKKFLEIR